MTHMIDFSQPMPAPASLANTGLELLQPSTEINERLITRAYAMVAEAERLIAEQRNRIKVLETLSYCDELTGILNCRGFEMALGRELGAVARDPLAAGMMILIDLDGFKRINDTFGHAAGDAYLVAVAERLRGLLREGDVVARIGGDEFAILLPRCKTTPGLRRTAQLQTALNAACCQWNGLALPLRASFGPAQYAGGDDMASVFKRADARLYSNKGSRKGGKQIA